MKKYILGLALCIPLIAVAADLTVTWPAAPAAEQVTHYEVWMGTNGVPGVGGGLVATTPDTNYTFTNITPGQSYSIAVRAVNLAGPGAFSDNVATAPPPGKVGTPVISVDP